MSQYGYGPEESGTPGTYAPAPPPPRRRRRLGGIIIALILILLIIILLCFFPRPTATVTLTPVSKGLNNTETVSVPTRVLSSVQQGTQSGVPTGPGGAGTPATGTLTFENYTPVAVTIPAGTPVTDTTGKQIVTDTDVVVPPDPIIPGVASVSAHAVKVGTSGNIPAMSVNGPCCSTISSGILAFNAAAFSGGRDAQKGPVVQQSDIDPVVNTLKTSLTQKALADIKSQLKADEQLVDTTPECEAKVTSNPGVGETAAQFTVDVSLTCSASAYSTQVPFQQVEETLKQMAAQQLGPDYVLVGRIIITVDKVTQGGYGGVNLQISASGTWKYQFTAARKQALAKSILGITVDKARSLLMQQKGVANVSLSLTGPIINLGGNNVLPDDPGAITING